MCVYLCTYIHILIYRILLQVPFLDDAASDGGSLDVWNTSDSVLDMCVCVCLCVSVCL